MSFRDELWAQKPAPLSIAKWAVRNAKRVVKDFDDDLALMRFLVRLDIYYYHDYKDNLSIVLLNRPHNLQDYLDARNRGCCGRVDELLTTHWDGEERMYLIGCNYGH